MNLIILSTLLAVTPMDYVYHYNASLVRVIDCDTIVVNIDLGFDLELKNRTLRLKGIDAYETKRNSRAKKQSEKFGITLDEVVKKGKDSTEKLKALLQNKQLVINTIETDSFGRWLAEVYVKDIEISLNNYLLQENMAVIYE
jgi:micrococcal nuclease